MALSWTQRVHSAYTGATLTMLPAGVMYIVQDSVTGLHAKEKCGNLELRDKGCFWVVTKSHAEILRYPDWYEEITVKVVSLEAGRIRTVFKVEMFDTEQKLCVRAMQELCVLDFARHRVQKLSDVGFAANQPAEPFPFTRFGLEAAPRFTQKVLPHMIDMSGHMNNVEYVKIAMDCFENAATTKREPQKMECHHLRECKEGDILTVGCKDGQEESLVRIYRENQLVFEMKVNWREKR